MNKADFKWWRGDKRCDMISCVMNPQQGNSLIGKNAGYEAGNNGSILHPPYGKHFQSENSPGERRTKYSPKTCSYTSHQHSAGIGFVQFKYLPIPIGNAAANLY